MKEEGRMWEPDGLADNAVDLLLDHMTRIISKIGNNSMQTFVRSATLTALSSNETFFSFFDKWLAFPTFCLQYARSSLRLR
jgi:hypothetical protein